MLKSTSHAYSLIIHDIFPDYTKKSNSSVIDAPSLIPWLFSTNKYLAIT